MELRVSNIEVVEKLQNELKEEILNYINNDIVWEAEYEDSITSFSSKFKNGSIVIHEDNLNFRKEG